jgi:hypothetical protein
LEQIDTEFHRLEIDRVRRLAGELRNIAGQVGGC